MGNTNTNNCNNNTNTNDAAAASAFLNSITEEQMDGLRAAFTSVDKDGTGSVTVDAIRALGLTQFKQFKNHEIAVMVTSWNKNPGWGSSTKNNSNSNSNSNWTWNSNANANNNDNNNNSNNSSNSNAWNTINTNNNNSNTTTNSALNNTSARNFGSTNTNTTNNANKNRNKNKNNKKNNKKSSGWNGGSTNTNTNKNNNSSSCNFKNTNTANKNKNNKNKNKSKNKNNSNTSYLWNCNSGGSNNNNSSSHLPRNTNNNNGNNGNNGNNSRNNGNDVDMNTSHASFVQNPHQMDISEGSKDSQNPNSSPLLNTSMVSSLNTPIGSNPRNIHNSTNSLTSPTKSRMSDISRVGADDFPLTDSQTSDLLLQTGISAVLKSNYPSVYALSRYNALGTVKLLIAGGDISGAVTKHEFKIESDLTGKDRCWLTYRENVLEWLSVNVNNNSDLTKVREQVRDYICNYYEKVAPQWPGVGKESRIFVKDLVLRGEVRTDNDIYLWSVTGTIRMQDCRLTEDLYTARIWGDPEVILKCLKCGARKFDEMNSFCEANLAGVKAEADKAVNKALTDLFSFGDF